LFKLEKTMSNWNQGKSISSTVHSIVWLGGLAILFMRGSFWPEILILVAVSMAADLILKMVIAKNGGDPEATDQPETAEPLAPIDVDADQNLNDRMQRIEPEPEPIPPVSAGNADRLPNTCPACGAPLTERDVQWLSGNKVKCGFCGTHVHLE
jgi:hypothetical protein